MEETQQQPQPEYTANGMMCSTCQQPQYNCYIGGTFSGVVCPAGHWNVPGIGAAESAYAPPPEEPPPPPIGTPQEWMKPLEEATLQHVNTMLENSSKLSALLEQQYTSREQIRQAIALLTCPFSIGQIVSTGEGTGPKDNKVVTLIRGGDTDNGEFWRAWGRVLTKSGKLGIKPMRIRPSGKGFRIVGQYAGVEALPVEEITEMRLV